MNYNVILEKQALKELKKLTKSGRKNDINKLYEILEELKIHPTTGIGNPKPLKHGLSGKWSRRINKKDRIIYEIIEEPERLVVVVSPLEYYN